MSVRYDADQAPDPAAWLAAAPADRLAAITDHHLARPDRIHPEGYRLQIHARLHHAIETQIAAGEPPIVAATIDRLCAQGLRRHVALHLVAEVLLRWMSTGLPFDPVAYDTELRRLDAATWLGRAMRRTLGSPE
ncbi:MAG: DUF1841 domain-containing protein [Myxococcota bacterium]